MVPVLSMMAFLSLHTRSRTSPSLMRMPSCAPLPMPTMSAVGVARPSAQGHATTITAMAGSRACCNSASGELGGTKKNHTQKVMAAMTRMAGTNTAAILSARRWTGALDPCASSTARTMRAKVESAPTRTAFTSSAPVVLSVPPVTSSPSRLATGSASPVSMDSSTSDAPCITTPSTGTFSPGRMRTTSPMTTADRGTSVTTPPRSTRAVGGARFMSDSMAWLVAPFARVSRILPRSTKVMSIAQVSKYGMPLLMATDSWLVQSPRTTGRNVIHSEKRNAIVVPSATSTSMLADPLLSDANAPL